MTPSRNACALASPRLRTAFAMLSGGGGNDLLTGGAKDDTRWGGDGDDTIEARDGGQNQIACDVGLDSLHADLGDADAIADGCEQVERAAPTPARRALAGVAARTRSRRTRSTGCLCRSPAQQTRAAVATGR